MKTDDFEQSLREQRLRPLPSAWRAEILATAREANAASQHDPADSLSLWKLILVRFPVAWGALAAVWAVILAGNLLVAGASAPAANLQGMATEETSALWRLQSAELRHLATGEDSLTENTSGAAPHSPAARPRSELRREDGLGESQPIESRFLITRFPRDV